MTRSRDFAKAAGVSPRTVQADRRRGAPTDDVAAYVAWRAANVRPYGEAARDPHLARETARLRAAQAEAAELDVAAKAGRLVELDDVKQVNLAASVVFASQLKALPDRMANALAAIGDPTLVEARLREECGRIYEAVLAEFGKLR